MNNIKHFYIEWTVVVEYSVDIKAVNKQEALKKWNKGEYDTSKIELNDTVVQNIQIEEIKMEDL